jgi:hypothetical protein
MAAGREVLRRDERPVLFTSLVNDPLAAEVVSSAKYGARRR